jgi:cytochrome b
VRVWDGPLRLWHWSFAACITGSLYTGLSGDIGLVQWHMRCGYGVLALLAFRLGWLLWGGIHARWSTFRLTPARMIAFLRGAPVPGPRTPPGVALVLGMFLAVTAQAVTGLFTSDFIFTDGPLVRHASDATVEAMSALHHRNFWVIIGLIVVHLTAHVVYGIRRDSTPFSMFTGYKRVPVPETPHFWLRALLTAAATTVIAWYALGAV